MGFDERDGRHENTVDLAIVPVGIGGKVYPLVNGHARLSLPPEDAEAVRTHGLRMVERLTLPAGTYQLHVAAREVRHGGAGSVICDLVVPDRSAPGLAMTPLLVSGTRARQVPSANRDDRVLRALGGGPPTTSRVFHRDETLSAYAEVTDVGAATRRDVELVTIVRDARDRDVVHSVRPNASDRAEPGHSFPYAIDIPLRTLPPGHYVLRVEARGGRRARAGRARMRFEVVGRLTRAVGGTRMRPMPSRNSFLVLAFALGARRRCSRPDARRASPGAPPEPRSRSRKRPRSGAGPEGRDAAAGRATPTPPPSDAIVLFDGKNLDEWVNVKGQTPATWLVQDGVIVVHKPSGNIETKRKFTNYQLHLEWRVPAGTTGTDQARGNSGVFLASTGNGDAGYELQILDSYENKTYVNGQAASIYKQSPPLVNAMRKPGEWNVYDVVWTAPVFNADGTVKSPALRHGAPQRRAGAEQLRAQGRDGLHRPAVVQGARAVADQAAVARRPEPADQLPQHLDPRAAVEFSKQLPSPTPNSQGIKLQLQSFPTPTAAAERAEVDGGWSSLGSGVISQLRRPAARPAAARGTRSPSRARRAACRCRPTRPRRPGRRTGPRCPTRTRRARSRCR